MAKKLYKKTGNSKYDIQGVLPSETEWDKVVSTDNVQTITGEKTFEIVNIKVVKTDINGAKVIGTDADGKLEQHSLAISDIAVLQSTLGRKLDGMPLESLTKATGKGVFSYTPSFGTNITKYKSLGGFIGSYYSVTKGGNVSNNNSYLYGVGRLNTGTYLGFVQVDRDYNSDDDAVYVSKGLYVSTGDALRSPSAYLLNGNSTTEYEVRLATEKDLANKQDTLVSGTNIKTLGGTSLLGSGNIDSLVLSKLKIGSYDTNAFDLSTCVYGIKFSDANYTVVNVESGSYSLTWDNTNIGSSFETNVTFHAGSKGSGTWHVVATCSADPSESTGGYGSQIVVGVGNVTTSGFLLSARRWNNSYTPPSKYIIHWIAVKYW